MATTTATSRRPTALRAGDHSAGAGGLRARNGAATATGVQRIYVAKVGPLGFILLALTIAILTAVAVVILLGAFLIAVPLAALLLVVALIAARGCVAGRADPRVNRFHPRPTIS